jgi:hypothetical protein
VLHQQLCNPLDYHKEPRKKKIYIGDSNSFSSGCGNTNEPKPQLILQRGEKMKRQESTTTTTTKRERLPSDNGDDKTRQPKTKNGQQQRRSSITQECHKSNFGKK